MGENMKTRKNIGWALLFVAISSLGYLAFWFLNLGSSNGPGDGGPNFVPLFILAGGIIGTLICGLTGLILVSPPGKFW